LPLLRAAVTAPSRVCLDLALDLLVLPVSYVYLNVAVLLLLAVFAAAQVPSLQIWVWLSAGCAGAAVLYILRGWKLSGVGARGLLDLARAPFFLAWKLVVMFSGRDSKEWVRTKRENS